MRDPGDEFLTIAAHDLKEPLRSIDLFSALLADEYGDRLGNDGKGYLQQLGKAARRLRVMVESLLVWGRLGAIVIAPEFCDTGAVVDAIRPSLAAGFPRGVIQIEGSLPAVQADPPLLYRVIANLVHNGLHYNRNAVPTVTIGGAREGEQARLWVRDNGIGIDPRNHQRIFQPWQRLHSHEAFDGSGLGLASCRRIVEAHGGRIWLESGPKTGSTFYFTMPAGAHADC